MQKAEPPLGKERKLRKNLARLYCTEEVSQKEKTSIIYQSMYVKS